MTGRQIYHSIMVAFNKKVVGCLNTTPGGCRLGGTDVGIGLCRGCLLLWVWATQDIYSIYHNWSRNLHHSMYHLYCWWSVLWPLWSAMNVIVRCHQWWVVARSLVVCSCCLALWSCLTCMRATRWWGLTYAIMGARLRASIGTINFDLLLLLANNFYL